MLPPALEESAGAGPAVYPSVGNAWLYHDGSIIMYPLACVAPDKPSLSESGVLVTVFTLWLLFIIFVQYLLCDLKARMGKLLDWEVSRYVY